MPYAIIDPDGTVRDLVEGVENAVQACAQYAPNVIVENSAISPAGGLSDSVGFGALSLSRPQHALRMSGLRPQSLPTERTMPLAKAHKLLLPFFPKTRYIKKDNLTRINTAYSTSAKMSDRLLGQNYKTAKIDEDNPTMTDVQGLSLMPARSLHTRPGMMKINACVGASPACIASCLVYSGHNTIDPYNVQVKAARLTALVQQPQAFLRMLAENIYRHARRERGNYAPYVRLNVFSDLPWELICPDLFDAFSTLSFYDYTKVENRVTPPNYDLTFSFSGINKAQVAHELDVNQRRVAVVFVPPWRAVAGGTKYDPHPRERGEGMPDTLDVGSVFGSQLGRLPVIDGDVSDVRPRDPAPSIVGLRWKIPMGFQQSALAHSQETGFVVPVIVGEHGVLIAATGARNEPIYDADDDDGGDVDDVGEEY